LLGSGVLTFLAGAEIDPVSLKANWRASVLIGTLSFAAPFAASWLIAQFVFGWSLHEAQLAGIALSTTSVAVVYAVMIEGGFSDTVMCLGSLAVAGAEETIAYLPRCELGIVLIDASAGLTQDDRNFAKHCNRKTASASITW